MEDPFTPPLVATFFYDPKEGEVPNSACYSGSFSGQHHPDNIRIELVNGSITAYHGDGTVRRFVPIEKKPSMAIPIVYELDSETLPSGNQRFLWCSKERGAFYKPGDVKLETRSSTGQFLNHLIMEKLHTKDSKAVTSDNLTAKYQEFKGTTIQRDNILGFHAFKDVTAQGGILHHYEYDDDCRLMRKELPNDRVMAKICYTWGEKVTELKQPTPNDLTKGNYAQTHRFTYEEKKGKHETCLRTPERGSISFLSEGGKLLQYKRNSKPMLSYNKGESCYSVQKFFWGNKEKREDLLTIGFFYNDYTRDAIGCRTFSYDKNHNVTEERLYGNLSVEL